MTAGKGYFMLKCVSEVDVVEFDALFEKSFPVVVKQQKVSIKAN